MTAKHLLAMHRRLQTEVGEESLGYRGQQGDEVFGAFTGGCVFAELGGVQLHGDVGREGTTALVQRLHGQQHAPHVGVYDDRVSDLVLGLRAGRGTALQTITGVLDGVLVGTFRRRQALDSHAQTLVVHHGEHRRQALVRRVDDPAGGAVEVHHAGGGRLDAHLVFDGATGQRVAFAQRAVGIDHHLGHQKQRNAFCPGGSTR
ncbi:hypothetical protein D9M73_187940 [compost metagenome]